MLFAGAEPVLLGRGVGTRKQPSSSTRGAEGPRGRRGAVGRTLLERAGLGELADLPELHADRALEVLVGERRALLGGEERGAQGGVADVAARQPEPLRQAGEVELAG